MLRVAGYLNGCQAQRSLYKNFAIITITNDYRLNTFQASYMSMIYRCFHSECVMKADVMLGIMEH